MVLCQNLEYPGIPIQARRGSPAELCDKDDSSLKQLGGTICWVAIQALESLCTIGKCACLYHWP